ncbi:hypothetical protein C3Y87_05800 [Carbonactinospora thermoautotrophica]|nr:hypothetical protein [Carbonactinospora thermoautotrophica]
MGALSLPTVSRLRHLEAPSPDGCRWCGFEARKHALVWVPSRGWHSWQAPTPAQRKARMLARRNRKS